MDSCKPQAAASVLRAVRKAGRVPGTPDTGLLGQKRAQEPEGGREGPPHRAGTARAAAGAPAVRVRARRACVWGQQRVPAPSGRGGGPAAASEPIRGQQCRRLARPLGVRSLLQDGDR